VVPGCQLTVPAGRLNFILVDRRWGVAKVCDGRDPTMLLTYLRSLRDPEQDGLIIADPRPEGAIVESFQAAGSFVNPPTDFVVCHSPLKEDGPKYSIHIGKACTTNGWHILDDSNFKGYFKPHKGMKPVTICDNEEYWTQTFAQGTECKPNFANMKWVFGDTIYVPEGKDFCVGSRARGHSETSFSRILVGMDSCGNEGFKHDFAFNGVSMQGLSGMKPRVLCVHDVGRTVSFVTASEACRGGRIFSVLSEAAATGSDRKYCVAKTSNGDLLYEAGSCGLGKAKLTFAVPALGPAPSGAKADTFGEARARLCVVRGGDGQAKVGVQEECDSHGSDMGVRIEAPSMRDIAASTPQGSGGDVRPLYALIQEEKDCFGFLCPAALEGLV